jgi:predicted NBD/HSP70 family sugar kinase
MRRTGDLKLIQELNRSIILDTIRKEGPISRSEIAKKIKISPTTVTSAINDLINEGLVTEGGTGVSNGGRKPIMVRFSPNNKFIIGVAINNYSVTICEMNLEAKIKNKKKYSLDSLVGEEVIQQIFYSISDFLIGYDGFDNCIGISIIIPGIVNAAKGEVVYNSKLQLKNVPLKEMVQTQFGLTTWLDNDVNAIALAEKYFGDYADDNYIIYVKVGDGVGAGIILEGKIFRGGNGGAGEFGHTSIDKDGIPCDCGNTGCLENYVSWPAVYSRILSSVARGKPTVMNELVDGNVMKLSPSTYIEALHLNDELAIEIMEEMASYLAVGVVNLVNLYNPEQILIGGDLIQDNNRLVERVKQIVSEKAIGTLLEGLTLQTASFGEDYELMGSAAILLQDVFNFSLSD